MPKVTKALVLTALLSLVCFASAFAQATGSARVKGRVLDENGTPLPFVAVYLEGTTKGTTSNTAGDYFLQLPAGTYSIVFRSVGYEQVVKQVTLAQGQTLTLDLSLKPNVTQLGEVKVSADGDQAKEIIRKAQDKRKFYLEQVEGYSCQSYIKGMYRMTDYPDEFMGEDVDLEEMRAPTQDSTDKTTVLYLSESVSEFHRQQPNKVKEIMISSKVSGDDQGFSWNSATEFDFNVYEKNINSIGERPFISPIAPTAFLYYDYELVDFYADGDQMINKIKVLPKAKGSPTFSGHIYIQEDSWRVHSTDLIVSKKQNFIPFIDTLRVRQNYAPVSEEVWMPTNQSFDINFSINLFGSAFVGDGYYVGVFSDYTLNPAFEKGFFGNEIIRVEEKANERDSVYWQQARPVQLTDYEAVDYEFKDSLQTVRKSETYLDSVDQENNKFKFNNLLWGYTYSNTHDGYRFSVISPLLNVQYNTVEGIVGNLDATFTFDDKDRKKYFSVGGTARYGEASERFYYKGRLYRKFDEVKNTYLAVEGGRFVRQFNKEQPISEMINNAYTLMWNDNYMKLYERAYGNVSFGQELFNGLRVDVAAGYEERTPLVNNSFLVYKGYDRKGIAFTSNNPLAPGVDGSSAFEQHSTAYVQAAATVRFGQKYISRPGEKINYGSRYPTLRMLYRKGIPDVLGSRPDYDFAEVSLSDRMNLGIFGTTEYLGAYGTFLNRNDVPFMDNAHFMTTQTIFANMRLRTFYLLPYYEFSTDEDYLEAHVEHHFNGFIFNKFPLVKRLTPQAVAGLHYLHTGQRANTRVASGLPASEDDFRLDHYTEFTLGIENILLILRVDYVLGVNGLRGDYEHGFRVSFGF